jgi:hypothetical protein
MKNEKFKQLIVDTYKISKTSKNLIGIVYGPISTYGFSDLINIEKFAETIGTEMLYLKSKSSNTEVDVYEYDLVDYEINNSDRTICIKLRNKEAVLMF